MAKNVQLALPGTGVPDKVITTADVQKSQVDSANALISKFNSGKNRTGVLRWRWGWRGVEFVLAIPKGGKHTPSGA